MKGASTLAALHRRCVPIPHNILHPTTLQPLTKSNLNPALCPLPCTLNPLHPAARGPTLPPSLPCYCHPPTCRNVVQLEGLNPTPLPCCGPPAHRRNVAQQQAAAAAGQAKGAPSTPSKQAAVVGKLGYAATALAGLGKDLNKNLLHMMQVRAGLAAGATYHHTAGSKPGLPDTKYIQGTVGAMNICGAFFIYFKLQLAFD